MQPLAKLGGWVPHKDRRPGKITLMCGLRRPLDMLATQAIRSSAAAQQGGLPLAISPFCKAGNLLNRIYDRMPVKLSTVLPATVAPTPILAAAPAVASRAVARC